MRTPSPPSSSDVDDEDGEEGGGLDYDTMQADVAYVNAWCARRYPATGGAGNYMHYNMVAYTDALLDEVGVVSSCSGNDGDSVTTTTVGQFVRRKRGWWRGLVEPVWAADLKGMVDFYKGG